MSRDPKQLAIPRFVPRDISPTAEQTLIQTHPARHVIAMANAGAAKTTTLALRIAEAITRGVAPGHILALSFSAEAARVLRQRLVALGLPREQAAQLPIQTFEGFARQVLEHHFADGAPSLASAESLAPRVREAMDQLRLRNSLRRHPRELWLPEHNPQIAEFLATTDQLKAALRPPELDDDAEESLESRAEAWGLPVGVLALYRQLEQLRGDDGRGRGWRGPFDGVFDLVRRLQTDPDAESRLPGYRIVIADELQDMNPASYALLQALLRRGKAFFTGAGDFDQVIHGWAGAQTDFVRHQFGADWPKAARLPLPRSYRHGPAMALAAGFLTDKPNLSGRPHAARIEDLRWESPSDADRLLVGAIQAHARHSKRKNSCAVLLRSPHLSIPVENALLAARIGYQTEGMGSYLERPEVLVLRGLMAFALQDYTSIPGEERRLQVLQALVLWQGLGWSEARNADLRTAARQPELFAAFLSGQLLRPKTRADLEHQRDSLDQENEAEARLLEEISQLSHAGEHHAANTLRAQLQAAHNQICETPAQIRARERLESALAALRTLPPEAPAQAALEQAVALLDMEGSARRLFIRPETVAQVLRSIQGFLAMAGRQGLGLAAFAHWLREAEEHLDQLRTRASVLLCSVDAAKGREFDTVILPGLDAREFPLEGADPVEERNRFYVAITRMRDQLVLLAPAQHPSPYLARLRLDKARSQGQAQLGLMDG